MTLNNGKLLNHVTIVATTHFVTDPRLKNNLSYYYINKCSQHRLMVEAEQQQAQPTHIDHIMKSGFTMNDLKGLQRFAEDGGEAEEQMLVPSRPGRRSSMGRTSPAFEMTRSASALEIDPYQIDGPDDKPDKKRGRSPFKFFSKKGRDQSKDKGKSKSPTDKNRGRGTCKLLINFIVKNYCYLSDCFFFFQLLVEAHLQ